MSLLFGTLLFGTIERFDSFDIEFTEARRSSRDWYFFSLWCVEFCVRFHWSVLISVSVVLNVANCIKYTLNRNAFEIRCQRSRCPIDFDRSSRVDGNSLNNNNVIIVGLTTNSKLTPETMKTAPKMMKKKRSVKMSGTPTNHSTKTKLTSLPDYVLEHILSMCSARDRHRFKNVCQRFQDVHRAFVKHKHIVARKRIHIESSAERRNQIALVLRVLREVNKTFMRVDDMQVSFYAGTTELFESLHRAVMTSDLIEMLEMFYEDAELMLSKQSLNVSYIVTLLSVLDQFSRVSRNCQRIADTRIHFKYVVHDIWCITISWPRLWRGGRVLKHPTESFSIVIMLTILLINEKRQRKLYEMHKYGPRTMIYGGGGGALSNLSKPVCSVTFEIDVIGDADIIDYFVGSESGTNEAHLDTPMNGGTLTSANILFKCKESTRLDGQSYVIRF